MEQEQPDFFVGKDSKKSKKSFFSEKELKSHAELAHSQQERKPKKTNAEKRQERLGQKLTETPAERKSRLRKQMQRQLPGGQVAGPTRDSSGRFLPRPKNDGVGNTGKASGVGSGLEVAINALDAVDIHAPDKYESTSPSDDAFIDAITREGTLAPGLKGVRDRIADRQAAEDYAQDLLDKVRELARRVRAERPCPADSNKDSRGYECSGRSAASRGPTSGYDVYVPVGQRR